MKKTTLLQAIGERIREVRMEQGMTQKDFAGRVGVSNSHLSELESGKASPGAEFMAALEEAFNVDLHWLITGNRVMYATANNFAVAKSDEEGSRRRMKNMMNLIATMESLVAEEQQKYQP